MAKIPYEQIAPEVDRLVINMVKAKDFQEVNYWVDVFNLYLEATGWDERSFEKEQLKRIDEGWDDEESSLRELRKKAN